MLVALGQGRKDPGLLCLLDGRVEVQNASWRSRAHLGRQVAGVDDGAFDDDHPITLALTGAGKYLARKAVGVGRSLRRLIVRPED
jgi:hypothetical protein